MRVALFFINIVHLTLLCGVNHIAVKNDARRDNKEIFKVLQESAVCVAV